MRRALSGLAFRIARGIQGLSLLIGGASAITFVIALIMLIFNSQHADAHWRDWTVGQWVWRAPLTGFLCWLIGFRLLASIFSWLAVALLPPEDRSWLAAAVEVSRDTGQPLPRLDQLHREHDEARARGDLVDWR